MKKTDIGVVGFMYGVCALFLVMTLRLKKAAQTYPIFIITVLALLTTLYVYYMVKDAKRLGVTSGIQEVFGETILAQFIPILGMILFYLLGMYYVGFYPATFFFMIACLWFLHVPKWQMMLSSLVVIGLVFGAFALFLGVKLPMGLLFK